MKAKTKTLKNFKPEWNIRDVVLVLFITVLLPMVVVYALKILASLHFVSDTFINFLSSDGVFSSTVRMAFNLILQIGMLWFMLKKYKIKISALGLRKFPILRSTIYIVSFYFLFAISILSAYLIVSIVLPSIDINQPQDHIFEFGTKGIGYIISFIVAVLIAPVIEEIYYRGFIFPAISKKTGYLLGAIISSSIFGLLHFQLNIIIYTFILGLFLSFMYYKLRSIFPGIILHFLNNFIAFLIVSKII